MGVPTGRSDKRIPEEVVVEPALPDGSQLKLGSSCLKREPSRDAGSHGTRLAPRRQRTAKFSGVWLPYPGPRYLLSARGKQQVCCWFGTFSPDWANSWYGGWARLANNA